MNQHREYMAFALYIGDCTRAGATGCRWGTLRDDLKEKWRKEADAKTNLWLASEESARRSREDDHNPRAFFA